jgi:hypothetical protein
MIETGLPWVIARVLRDCLCARLAADTIGGAVCRCSLMAGDSAIADVCETDPVTGANGQAWVRVVRVFLSREFPQPATDAYNACTGGLWAAEYELGVLRCAVGPDDEGQPPSAAQLNAEAAMVMDDAYALRLTAECCLPPVFPRLAADWTPRSSGGCTGGTVSVTVHMVPGPHDLVLPQQHALVVSDSVGLTSGTGEVGAGQQFSLVFGDSVGLTSI